MTTTGAPVARLRPSLTSALPLVASVVCGPRSVVRRPGVPASPFALPKSQILRSDPSPFALSGGSHRVRHCRATSGRENTWRKRLSCRGVWTIGVCLNRLGDYVALACREASGRAPWARRAFSRPAGTHPA